MGTIAKKQKIMSSFAQVEKKKMSKQKTGGAKRRIHYNHRFATVVQTYGRHWGPNVNLVSQTFSMNVMMYNFCTFSGVIDKNKYNIYKMNEYK